jgi:hypothetical protein
MQRLKNYMKCSCLVYLLNASLIGKGNGMNDASGENGADEIEYDRRISKFNGPLLICLDF